MQNGTLGMDERDTTPGTPVHVPRPRTWGEDTGTAYRELFDAAASSPVVDAPLPRRPRRSRRRTRLLLLSAVLVLALVAAAVVGGLAYAAHARKQPSLDALRTGNTAFEPIAAGLRRATDLDGLRTAATGAGAAADEVDRAAEGATTSTALGRAVRDVLRDESSLLRAANGLSTLSIETIGTWPKLRDTMGDAEAALDADVRHLAAVEAGAAGQVRTGRGLAVHSDDVVAGFAASSIVDLLDTQLEGLVGAKTTADLRAVAASAAKSGGVVSLALQGVDPASDEGARITRVGTALTAIGKLTTISGDKLGAWAPVRAELTAATTGVEGVDARNALVAVDGLVARAAAQLKAWQTATAAATQASAKDTATLTAYTTAVGAALTAQAAADQAAADFLTRVKTDAELTSQDAVTYLDAAAKARDAVTTALTDAAPAGPSLKSLREPHQGLVDAAQQAADAVKAGRAGTKKQQCGTVPPTTPGGKPTPAPCYYSATPGYAAFSAGTAQAAQALTPARTAWDQAVTAAQKAIAERKLPTKPVV